MRLLEERHRNVTQDFVCVWSFDWPLKIHKLVFLWYFYIHAGHLIMGCVSFAHFKGMEFVVIFLCGK